MLKETITRADARRIYNELGTGLDRATRFEGRAKAFALDRLAVTAGQTVLHVGVGTGVEHARLRAAVEPGGVVFGVDLARAMLALTRLRAPTPLSEADAAYLPFAPASFDRVFSAYVLDLLPAPHLPLALAEFSRVLRPGGRLVLVSLTEGINPASRLFVAGWKLGFRLNPRRFGGCRPLELGELLAAAGFRAERHVVVQRGFPSEVLVAETRLS